MVKGYNIYYIIFNSNINIESYVIYEAKNTKELKGMMDDKIPLDDIISIREISHKNPLGDHIELKKF